jgi:hypothetical protein
VRDASQLKLSFRHTAMNLLLTALLLLLIAFPSELFNATVQEHYDEITGWFGGNRLAGLRSRLSNLPPWVGLASFGVAGALLYSQLSPDFSFNESSLALVIGMFVALVGAVFIFEVARAGYVHRRFKVDGRLKAFPTGMLFGAVLVVLSRLAHFQPGYLFGLFAAAVFGDRITSKHEGESLAVAAVSLLAVGAAAWLAWIPVKHLATKPGAGLAILCLDATLATLWVAAMCIVVFGLLPVRWLNGEKVMAWSRPGWAMIYGVGMFVFLQTALFPNGGFANTSSSRHSFMSMLILFLAFGALSVLFWAYFRYRFLWRKQELGEEP